MRFRKKISIQTKKTQYSLWDALHKTEKGNQKKEEP